MIKVIVTIQNGVPSHSMDPWLLMPRPIDDWQTTFNNVEITGVSEIRELGALNSRQRAYLVKPTDLFQTPQINYSFERTSSTAPDWFWQLQTNRYTQASTDLKLLARQIVNSSRNDSERVSKLISHAAELFGYGHEETRFNDHHETVPVVCGTTKGSCVDINTYLIAAANSLDIPVQYIAGYWCHPHKTETRDMHCWLAFKLDGETVFWDLAHHLKWGISNFQPGLNPAGGQRVPMSCGRGLYFDTPHGEVEISHFSEPLWITEKSQVVSPQLLIRFHENT
jgi:hypothetical protein